MALPTGPGVKAEVVLRSIGDTDHVVARDAELVFVGYGIVAPERGWDDYRGVDVKGKIVVVLNFNPPWAGEGVRLWYGRWDYKYLEAARHGAVGALVIHTTESASYPWQVVSSSNRAVAVGAAAGGRRRSAPAVPGLDHATTPPPASSRWPAATSPPTRPRPRTRPATGGCPRRSESPPRSTCRSCASGSRAPT